MNPIRPLLWIQPNLTVSIFLDHPVFSMSNHAYFVIIRIILILHDVKITCSHYSCQFQVTILVNFTSKLLLNVCNVLAFWPRAMLKGPKRSFIAVVVVFVLGVESSSRNVRGNNKCWWEQNKTKWIWIYDRQKIRYFAIKGHTRPH